MKALLLRADLASPATVEELTQSYLDSIGAPEHLLKLICTMRLAGKVHTVEVLVRSFRFDTEETFRPPIPNERATQLFDRKIYGNVAVVGLMNADFPAPECFEPR